MNLIQAEVAINTLIADYNGSVIQEDIRFENQCDSDGKAFEPPKDKPWCRISTDYSNTVFSGFGNKPKFRDFGIISIQCFVPKNSGTLLLMQICQEWRELLESKSKDGLEIYLVHAPQNIDDDDFYAKIIRAEFRVN